jgi:hypothetical protein
MKPLNLDNSPCSPISSNCVIWQGPDIPCIKLCTGDTVSDVIYKLATELCNIMDLLDVNGYDLSCFDLASCKPQNIQELIQFLIGRICDLEAVNAAEAATPTTNGTTRSTTADTLVTVAPCFIIGTTTVMTIAEYAQAMGSRICSIVDQITLINNQLNSLNIRVTALESAPAPSFTTPSIVVDCTLSNPTVIAGNTYTIDIVLNALVNDNTYGYCALLTSTGLPSAIASAVLSQCIANTSSTLTNPPVPFATEYLGSWVNTPTTVADAINNLWITVCDIYQYLTLLTFTGDTTSTIQLTVSSGPAHTFSAKLLDTGWVDLDGFGYYSGTTGSTVVPQARRIGNVVHFRGLLVVPIDDGGGNALGWNYGFAPAVDTYYLSTTATPASVGAGSVVMSTAGSITFNQGNSVIPTSIMAVGEQFDNAYSTNFLIGARPVQIDASPATSTILSGLFNISISENKLLTISLPKNAEQNAFSGTGAFDTSHLNYIVSHVISGDNVPKFDNANTNVNSNTGAGTIALDLEYDATLTYPFTCNANNEQQVGGFRIQLDGLVAYIDPCTTDIPTPIVCP